MHAFLHESKVRHLLLSGLSSFAQAAVIGQAKASVSNFAFSVKDLDPADGIAPSFTVRQSVTHDASVWVLKYKEDPSGSLITVESDDSYDRRRGSASVNIFSPKPLEAALPMVARRRQATPSSSKAN